MRTPGLILINKPVGITSFQLLFPIKRKFATKKVGHAGTLDSFAEGLMLVLLGQGTKLLRYFVHFGKSYRAELCFGVETDTLDSGGTVIAHGELPDRDRLLSALDAFRGTIQQTPPRFSAIHIEGKRAYQRALAGEDFEMPSRRVEIHDLRLVSYNENKAIIDVSCSKGTYIRSLARDIALAVGSRAHLTALKRSAVGPFRCEDALDLQCFRDLAEDKTKDCIIWGAELLGKIPGLRSVTVGDTLARRVRQGAVLRLSDIVADGGDSVADGGDSIADGGGSIADRGAGLLGLVDRNDAILAVLEQPPADALARDPSLKYHSVFPALEGNAPLGAGG